MNEVRSKPAPARWLLSLGFKFTRVVPLRTLWVVLLTLVAQISYILAFFLPLKIVILLGSDGIPRYFPPSFAEVDRDLLVVYLSLATLSFFIINIVAEKLTDTVTGGATQSLLARSHKIVLFENQEDIAAKAYQSFSRALAGMIFGGLALTVLCFIYGEMALLMLGYMGASAFSVLAATKSDAFIEYLEGNFNALLSNLSSVGFFVVFGYLVLDFVWLQPPGIIVAIISVLLGRQAFSRVSGAVKGLYRLEKQREKLDALFFHGRPLVTGMENKKNSFWHYLNPDQRKEWIVELLAEYRCRIRQGELSGRLYWQQQTMPQVGGFLYEEQASVFLIKLYDGKKSLAAHHEVTLLADAPRGLPAPEFKGSSQVGDFPCSLYRLEPGKVLNNGKHKREMIGLKAALLAVEPPLELAQRYRRSKPTLAHRMSTQWLDRALVAVEKETQQIALEQLRVHWPVLQAIIEALPLTIHNPDMKPWTIWKIKETGHLVLLNWEKWSLEPAGAGWFTGSNALAQLVEFYHEALEKRPTLHRCVPEHLMLAALVFELERLMQRQQLSETVRLVIRIWQVLEPLIPHDYKWLPGKSAVGG